MNSLQPYEELAKMLADAYIKADVQAIREMNWKRGTSFVWDNEPEKMHQRLANWYAAVYRTEELALHDARNMVARSYGFTDWEKLEAGLLEQAPDPRSVPVYRSVVPPFFLINWKENSISVNGPLSMQDWDKIFGVIEEQKLTRLNASEISEAAMEQLPQQLTQLSSGGITDEGLLHLQRMPQLERLDLGNWHSVITDRGLEVLQHLKNLRLFEMVWAQRITDTGMAHLANCDLLERVNVLGTRTGDGLIKAMAGKKNLAHLTTGVAVTDEGIASLHQLPVFKTWQGGEVKFDTMSFSAEPNHLLMGGPITDKGLAALAGLNGLVGLSFFGDGGRFTGKGLSSLAALPKLSFLGIDGKLCTDEAMEAIGGLPQLRMLMAQGTVATDDGFTALARSRTIEYIWGRECENLRGRGFLALSTMPALRGLAVSCKFVDEEVLSALPRFPALKQFMPMDFTDAGFRHIGQCEQLEAIWCMYCRETTDLATEHLAGLKNLRSYYAGQTLISNRSLEILGKMISLEQVQLWNISGITNEGLVALKIGRAHV